MSYRLEPSLFFDARSEGLRFVAKGDESIATDAEHIEMRCNIVRFVRTPNGEGLGVLRTDGSIETWVLDVAGNGSVRNCLKATESDTVNQLVVLSRGQYQINHAPVTTDTER